jgi:DNA-binding NtrC family response regulator
VTGHEARTRLSILLVDDEPAVLRALERVLTMDGHHVYKAGDPLMALDVLAREHVEVLIADIDMPRMSGVELVARVRREHPAVVRILLTGRASLNSTITAINEGEVFRYVTKPWDFEEMRATLQAAAARALENGQLARRRAAHEQHARLLEAIEAAFPGITNVERTEGDHVIDPLRVGRGLAHFDSQPLLALWRGQAPRD